ncbi:MAG: hypothetical protein ACYCZX_11765 [Rhodospirillaceae bacterium]
MTKKPAGSSHMSGWKGALMRLDDLVGDHGRNAKAGVPEIIAEAFSWI